MIDDLFVKRTSLPITLLLTACGAVTAGVCLAAVPPAVSNHPPVTLFEQLPQSEIAALLGWEPDNSNSLCQGHYRQPKVVLSAAQPGELTSERAHFTATEPALFSERGTSILRGNVTATQPGRKAMADTAYFYRDSKTHRICRANFLGNVHFYEPGRLVIADHNHVNFCGRTSEFFHLLYHSTTEAATGEPLDAWGRAEYAKRDQDGVLHVRHGTYTTCQPNCHAWEVRGSTIVLNKHTGRGEVFNGRLYVHHVPVFYLPYFNFPIDDRRKTGFLYPTFQYTNHTGFAFSLPFYWNLAPNYDLTLTPSYYTQRGVLGTGVFRYLSAEGHGDLTLRYIPHDGTFNQFKTDAWSQYSPYIHTDPNGPAIEESLRRLQDDGNDRGLIGFYDHRQYGSHFSSRAILDYVSDDYFFQDFASVPTILDTDQLLNRVDFYYDSEHWHGLARVQAYQTLHAVNRFVTSNQYRRLPQLDLEGDYLSPQAHIGTKLSTEFIHFDHAAVFGTDNRVPTGNRVNIQPSISWQNTWASGFFVPRLQLQLTDYSLKDQPAGYDEHLTRGLPEFDVDSGLYFDRWIHLFGQGYRQTFEPRLFYVYVPYHNQDEIPLFDTTLPTFSYDQMFRVNRFIGEDRIGDANQMAWGLTTRFLDSYTGVERLKASIGQMYYFRRHQVTGGSSGTYRQDPGLTQHLSSLSGLLSYRINANWRVSGDMAWNPKTGDTDNGSLWIRYRRDNKHIINLAYDFLRDGDPWDDDASASGYKDNLYRLTLSGVWPLVHHIQALGSWSYNISHQHPESYFLGLQYDSCCWAVRAVASRDFVSLSANDKPQYDNQYYLQFMLKGLGNVGVSDAGTLLTQGISGYKDKFAMGRSF